jgi:hypothetical protein
LQIAAISSVATANSGRTRNVENWNNVLTHERISIKVVKVYDVCSITYARSIDFRSIWISRRIITPIVSARWKAIIQQVAS